MIWLVTGASRGIGKAIAVHVAQQGDTVYAGCRNPTMLSAEAQNFPNLIPLLLDVTNPSHRQSVLAQIQARHGHLHVLVNNAGYGLAGALEELTENQIQKQMETNFLAATFLIRESLPLLRRQTPSFIFNITSVAGYFGFRGMSLYNASKFALVGLSEALAHELRPLQVWVCSVGPGPYRTDWAGPSLEVSTGVKHLDPHSPYYELNKTMSERFAQTHGTQPGDPFHIARLLYNTIRQGYAPIHMIVGDEAQQIWDKYLPYRTQPEYFRFIPHSQDHL